MRKYYLAEKSKEKSENDKPIGDNAGQILSGRKQNRSESDFILLPRDNRP
jgi:hypothetical protein